MEERDGVLRSVRPGGLWRHPDFCRFWAGQTVSLAGSLIGRFALPLVAIMALDASPGQVAMIRMADVLPGVAIGLLAGVWADRARRRPIMVWADVGRAVVLATIPLAAVFGMLRLEQVVIVVLVAGTLTALFEVAYQSYLPTLVSRSDLVEANSKLQASGSAVEVASFGFAGVLVHWLSAPGAILLDALSFVASALFLGSIRAVEPSLRRRAAEQTTREAIREGLRIIWRDPVLRALAGARTIRDFFVCVWVSMLLIFLTRDLDLDPVVFGILFAVGGICALVGATLAGHVDRWLGLGPTLVLTALLTSLGLLAVPLAGGPYVLVVVLVGAQQLADAPATVYEIHESSLIQSSVPDESLGRVTASLRVLGWSAMLAGTAAGGVLGELVGPRATMLIGAVGCLPWALWLLLSPVRRLRTLPASAT